MTTYRWRPGHSKGGDIQKIGEQLQSLIDRHGDRLTAPIVVDAARPKSAALHSQFEWSDEKAAEMYRRWQAREVMNKIDILIEDCEAPQPMFVNVVERVGDDDLRGYVTTARVLSDPVLTSQLLEKASDDIESFRERYGRFKELARIADAAQEAINALMARTERAVA